MRKISGITAVFVLTSIFPFSDSFGADKRTDRLFELYNSTATPAIYKDRIGFIIKSLERRKTVIEAAKGKQAKSRSAKPAALKAVSPQNADASFQAGEVYCFPNPARKANPTFHIETGIADKVELRICRVKLLRGFFSGS